MLLSLLFIHQTLSAVYIEYRFSRNFGKIFYDYSGNGRYGSNVIPSLTYPTDRGVYYFGNKSNIQVPSILLPPTYTMLTWIYATNSQCRILYALSSSSCRFHIGRFDSNSSAYIQMTDSGDFSKYGPANSFPSGQWLLAALIFDGTSFRASINTFVQATSSHIFGCATTVNFIGIGSPDTSCTAINGFIWNFVMLSDDTSLNNYISLTSSTTCLNGISTCSICNPAIIDPGLGTGCLSTEPDAAKNSNSITCSPSGIGCTKTTQLLNTTSSKVCGYDWERNLCYTQDKTTGVNTTIACSCQTSYSSRNNQCCNSDCASCNYTGFCLTCISLNSYPVDGVCQCNSGYYAYTALTAADSCCLLGASCITCSNLNSCLSCSEGFYLSVSSCLACGAGCKTCTSLSSCSACFSSDASVSGGTCVCNEGFFSSSDKVCTALERGFDQVAT